MSLSLSFAAALARLLPSGLSPRLALAVSGGADSMALALLARDYCVARGGHVLGLIADHGLRPESAQEALLVASRVRALGIPSQILTLHLAAGPALQARARAARYRALTAATLAAGYTHLALGHHLADQYETVAMRLRRGQGGGEGMAAWTARDDAVLIRPLLEIHPALLRAFLCEQGVAWVEDPSNQLRRFERVRIRQDQAGEKPRGLAERQARDQEVADFLARHAELHPEGYAVLAADSLPEAALGALLRTIGGRLYAPARAALRRLAGGLCPATLGGVRITRAGRLGDGWLLAREPVACAPPVMAAAQARWDERFTLLSPVGDRLSFGALGAQARLFRGHKGLPSLVLQALPALHAGDGQVIFPVNAAFTPPVPMTQHPFRV